MIKQIQLGIIHVVNRQESGGKKRFFMSVTLCLKTAIRKEITAIFILLGNRSNVTSAKFAAAEINIFVSSESSNDTLACTQEDIGQYP